MPSTQSNREPKEKRSFFANFMLILLSAAGVLFVCFILFNIVAPARLVIYSRPSNWYLENAAWVHQGEKKLLFVHTTNAIMKGRDITGIFLIDPATGNYMANRYSYNPLELVGITPATVWMRTWSKNVVGYSVNDLRKVYDMNRSMKSHPEMKGLINYVYLDDTADVLKIDGRDGNVYRWEAATNKLDRLDEELHGEPLLIGPVRSQCSGDDVSGRIGNMNILEGYVVCDQHTGEQLRFANGDYLVCSRSLIGDDGKVVMTRMLADGSGAIWQAGEPELFSGSKERKRGRMLNVAFQDEKRLYLIFEDRDRHSIYTVCLDAATGTRQWIKVVG